MKLKDLLLESQLPQLGANFTVVGKIFSAKKKQTMKVVSSPVDMPDNSLYNKTDDEPNEIITSLDGNAKEAIAKATKGDWIACGAKGEKWVIKAKSFGELYKINNNVATPIQIKAFLEIKSVTNMVWKNAWNETKTIPAGKEYYLMANTDEDLKKMNWAEINPMDKDAFSKTY